MQIGGHIYKVRDRRLVKPATSELTEYKFVSIRVKCETYNGHSVFAILVSDVTKKIKQRVENMKI